MKGRVLAALSLAGAMAFGLPTAASAATKTIAKPMFNGNRLDWCANWSRDCGKPAADAWCKAQGFAEAVNFSRDPHIGWKTPTRVIANNALCDLGHCDGFIEITCLKTETVAPVRAARVDAEAKADAKASAAKPQVLASIAAVPIPVPKPPPPKPGLFAEPSYNGKRLDWCRDWNNTGCGQVAADAFCASKGFARAATFIPDPHIGDLSPTRLIGSGAVCDQATCDGFKEISCAD